MQVLFALILLVLGWYGRDAVDWLLRERRLRIAQARQKALAETAPNTVVRYYEERALEHILYLPEDGSPIPYLTQPAWYADDLHEKLHFSLLVTTDREHGRRSINRKIVRRHDRVGHRVWDNPVYVLDRIESDPSHLTIVIRPSTYFHYLSRSGELRDELIASASGKKTPLRDKVASSLELLSTGEMGGQVIGFTTATVLNTDDGYKLIMQTRSSRTAIAGGRSAVVPCFVTSPSEDAKAREFDPYHHFLLEFYEELYQMDDQLDDRHGLSRTWFYSEPPVESLVAMRQSGRMEFRILGVGFDGYTGELNVAAAAVVHDPQFYADEVRQMQKNWEINGLELHECSQKALRRLAARSDLYHTSAFTVSLLSDYFDGIESGQRLRSA